ncbi:MAG: hypothetical protein QXG39_08490 [Candidatus Aenigmatarchaeota archaeon]
MSNLEKGLRITPKSKLTLKCHKCGGRTNIKLSTPLTCVKCGHIFTYTCLVCDYEFSLGEEVSYCSKCGWFICPRCGSCGCYVKTLISAFRKIREAVRKEDGLRVYGLMPHFILEEEEDGEIIIRHLFLRKILKRGKGRR